MAQDNGFLRDMSASRGSLALGALIFGRWRPGPVLAACLLFAADAAQARLQGATLPGTGVVPVQAVQALPYLIYGRDPGGFCRHRDPRVLGKPYSPAR